MNWQQVVTHDDAYASLVRAHHRRELLEARRRRRVRTRRLLLIPALAGLALLGWAIFSFDDANLQMLKIAAGMVLLIPWMATFDYMGQVPR
jgi:small neutral amino acid transporter SnatA (MarC family)